MNKLEELDALEALEMTAGIEELFSLGGFIEECTRKMIKKAWDNALDSIAKKMEVPYIPKSSMNELSKKIAEAVDDYKADPESEELYLSLMDMAEAHFVAFREEDAKEDNNDFDFSQYLRRAD